MVKIIWEPIRFWCQSKRRYLRDHSSLRAKLSGLDSQFARYERQIIAGKINCPFTVEFRDIKGDLITNKPLALTPNGNLKNKAILPRQGSFQWD